MQNINKKSSFWINSIDRKILSRYNTGIEATTT